MLSCVTFKLHKSKNFTSSFLYFWVLRTFHNQCSDLNFLIWANWATWMKFLNIRKTHFLPEFENPKICTEIVFFFFLFFNIENFTKRNSDFKNSEGLFSKTDISVQYIQWCLTTLKYSVVITFHNVISSYGYNSNYYCND